jgi:SAM-dependent methyltransferase
MSVQNVQNHYSGEDTGISIAARILAALRSVNGNGAAVTPEALEPLDHFNARGVEATRELAALLDPEIGETILDIGCGIGGPARWIAARCGCAVTGVDLTTAFCEAARELNAACGMTDQVRIFAGSATALPLPDATFDRAYSHGVLMSIADKTAFFPGGISHPQTRRPAGTLSTQCRPKRSARFPAALGGGPRRQLSGD